MTPLIARARRKLAHYPQVRYTATATRLHVPAPEPGGFGIRLHSRGKRYIVRFEGWVRVFDRDDDALDCFEFGLSDSCRLAVKLRGSIAVAWTVETTQYGLWAAHHRTARWLAPFWGTARTEYLQNHVIVSRTWAKNRAALSPDESVGPSDAMPAV